MPFFVGSTGDDILVGTDQDETITGLEGNDVLSGAGGDDLLQGGDGNDTLITYGSDTLFGGAGDDVLLVTQDPPPGQVYNGGDGYDRLVVSPTIPFTVGLHRTSLSGIEQIDLNDHGVLMTPDQLAGVTTITGFGANAYIAMDATGDLDLGAITLGTGNGIATIFTREYVQPQNIQDFTWDASTSTGTWDMRDHTDASAHLIGGAQNDTLGGSAGDTLEGGAGDDTLYMLNLSNNTGFTIFDGGAGEDTVSANPLQNFETSVFIDVEVFSGGGSMRGAALNGFDRFENTQVLRVTTPGTYDLSGKVASTALTYDTTGRDYFRLFGSYNNDHITWTDTRFGIEIDAEAGHDTIITGAGNDKIEGGGGFYSVYDNDLITSGAGSDVIYGNVGDDTIDGGDDNDLIFGGDGSDSLLGGAGNDVIHADGEFQVGPNGDFIDGGTGNDRIFGSRDDDILLGGDGHDNISAGDGKDNIDGGDGADTIAANAGDDTLSGSALSDLLFGGDGMDFLNGGFGFDRLNGGAGADDFYHAGAAGHGTDWVQDYSAAQGDILWYGTGGGGTASASDFVVQYAQTTGAGTAGVQEAFVRHIPTDTILWALVDGAAQSQINLRIGTDIVDLLA